MAETAASAPVPKPEDRPASSARADAVQQRQEQFSFPPKPAPKETYGSDTRQVAVASSGLSGALDSDPIEDLLPSAAASRPSAHSSASPLLFPPKALVTFHPGVPLPRDPWQTVPSASQGVPWLLPDNQDGDYHVLDNPPPGGIGGGDGGGGNSQGGDNNGTFYLKEGEKRGFWFDTGINATHVWDFYRINWGDGTSEEGDAMNVWHPPFIAQNHMWGDNGTYQITVSWWNYAGQSGGTTATVIVSNVAPTVGVNLPFPFIDTFQENTHDDTGTEVGVWITMADPGWLDTVTMNVDWGDGRADEFVYSPGYWPDHYIHQVFRHYYLDDDPTGTPEDDYHIVVTAKDDDGGIGSDSLKITFQNVAPQVAWLAPWQLDEGCMATLQVWTKDNPHDDGVLRIDWGDGSEQTVVEHAPITGFASIGFNPDPLVFQHKYVDDDPTATPWDNYALSVTLKDDDGGYSGDGASPVRIDNVAPTAELTNDGPWLPGEEVTVQFTNVQDPGTADTHEYAVDWNSDGDYDDESEGWSGEATRTHIFSDYGDYLITGAIRDDDTGQTKVSTLVQVAPVTVTKIEYLPKGQGTTGDLSNDNPNGKLTDGIPEFGGGWRFFPDAQSWQTNQASRNIVRIRATLSHARFNQKVYFRSFDVDDPSQDAIIDPNGSIGADNRGTVIGQSFNIPGDSILTDENTLNGYRGRLRRVNGAFQNEGDTLEVPSSVDALGRGYVEVELATSFAPGDNFRVVASMNQQEVVDLTDWTSVPTTGNMVNFSGQVSDQLSIWRHFHVEQDRMKYDENIQGDKQSGQTTGTPVQIPHTPYFSVTTDIKVLSADEYESGYLRIDGKNYRISGNTTGVDATFYSVGNPGIGKITVYQDDWNANGDNEPFLRRSTQVDIDMYDFMQVKVNRFENRFADAYLEPESTQLDMFDSNDVASFGHFKGFDQFTLVENNRGSKAVETDLYWTVYVMTDFEGDILEDHDPSTESATYGFSSTKYQTSVVFLETIRDTFDAWNITEESNRSQVGLASSCHSAYHVAGHGCPTYRYP